MKSAKALPRYGSGHKSAYSKKHFFKIQRAITLFLTDGVQCHLVCIILLCIYILIPSFNEIRQSTSKTWLRTQSAGQTAGRTDNAKTISLRLWRGIIIHKTQLTLINVYGLNIDESKFYETLHSDKINNKDKNILVGGDFNFVFNA
jgi:hypothetical protein